MHFVERYGGVTLLPFANAQHISSGNWSAEGVLKGKQTPMKVVNIVATKLKRNKLQGAELLLNSLHGLPSGMDSNTLLEALANGEAIPAPPEKKRGRKKKTHASGEEATAREAPKAKRKARKEVAEA